MNLDLPAGMTAVLELPASASSKGVSINGQPAPAKRAGSRWLVDKPVSGTVSVVVE
jgi:hypothetical protein